MVAIGFLVVLGAYGLGLSGYSLIRGYNNQLGSLWNPVKTATWTTQCYTGTGVLPSGNPADSGSCGGAAASTTPTTTNLSTGTVAGANPKLVVVAGRGR
jgi:hypothetical protein